MRIKLLHTTYVADMIVFLLHWSTAKAWALSVYFHTPSVTGNWSSRTQYLVYVRLHRRCQGRLPSWSTCTASYSKRIRGWLPRQYRVCRAWQEPPAMCSAAPMAESILAIHSSFSSASSLARFKIFCTDLARLKCITNTTFILGSLH
jgi:hypothetical protein